MIYLRLSVPTFGRRVTFPNERLRLRLLVEFRFLWKRHVTVVKRLIQLGSKDSNVVSRWSGSHGIKQSGSFILHDLFTNKFLYEGVKDWLYLLSHCVLKTQCEAVVESMASVVSKHASSIRGLSHENYVMESMLDWNGHATTECENFLTAALNRHFDSQTWHFRTEIGRSMKSVSAVIDKRLNGTSKLPFVVS